MKYILNIQMFGGRGASVKTGTERRKDDPWGLLPTEKEKADFHAKMVEARSRKKQMHLGTAEVESFVQSNSAEDFQKHNAPGKITVGNVPMTLTSAFTQPGRNGVIEHYAMYQSDVQDSNGEWPIFQTVVTERKRLGKTYYKFSRDTKIQ